MVAAAYRGGMTLSTTIPALPVQNIAAATAFYADRLGFSVEQQDDRYAVVRRDGAELNLWLASDDRWKSREGEQKHPVQSGAESFIAGTASCRIETDAIDALYSELRAAQVLHPTDRGSALATGWGTREFAILDVEGNLITFYQRA